jgi:hypothetical protein
VDDAIEALALLQAAEGEKWCMVPPNQETSGWNIYRRFDGEFGYQDELATGPTLIEALRSACIESATESCILECLRQRARECNAIAAWVRRQKNGTYLEGVAVACENRAFQLRQMAAKWEATVSRNGGNG